MCGQKNEELDGMEWEMEMDKFVSTWMVKMDYCRVSKPRGQLTGN